MAKLTFNPLFEVLHSGPGGPVFRHRPNGTIIVSGAPVYRKDKATPGKRNTGAASWTSSTA